jgi:hypothetical protein
MSKFNDFRSKLADELEIPNDALSDNFELSMHGNKKSDNRKPFRFKGL